jgi:anti-sigma28 factor (negative regulator of flagellin synthesis)
MRIDPKVVVTPITFDKQKAAEAKKSSPAKSTDSVVVLSKAAASIAPEGAHEPGVAAKLERIRALLDAGKYPVDLDLLASNIVDDEVARTRKP